MPKRVIILGAAGRDFHNFNTVFRNDPSVKVVAFTATQIPGVSGRRYPAGLAGYLYPEGIPIEDETDLEWLISDYNVDEVVFAYSDVTHDHVMHVASRVLATGADFSLLGPDRTMLEAKRAVIAITAVRTGSGKSQIARWLTRKLRRDGYQVVALRHPMPYGDLIREKVQRFGSPKDLTDAACTTEEREEYEPHIACGNVVYAGVDYQAILELAEAEADVIVWDGGNNDFPFIRPNLAICVVDVLRPDQVTTHHPGETVVRMADVVVVNKVNAASDSAVDRLIASVLAVNPKATVVRAASPVTLDDVAAVAGKRVLVVEDGPTITHGGMPHGAGYAAALAAGVAEIVDPRESATPAITEVFDHHPHIGKVLPAMGYGPAQLAGLEATINGSSAEVVVVGTPVNLAGLLHLTKPAVRARYEFAEAGSPTLAGVIDEFVQHQMVRR
jgi:predicted GTPase